MIELDLKDEVTRKELQLSALLEITQAINRNMAEEALYKIFNFTLRSNLHITKLALFVFGAKPTCKIFFGTKNDFSKITLDESCKRIKNILPASSLDHDIFHEFDMVIPVVHKRSTLALVFIKQAKNYSFDEDAINFIQALSNIIMVAIENKKLVKQQLIQETTRKEMEIARDVQQLLFPEKLPCTNTLNMEAVYLPHDLIGGDYYDYIPIDENRSFICIADVSGKGIPAAIMMSNFQAYLHALLRKTTQLKDIVQELNYHVIKNTKGEKIITFFCAIYDLNTKTLSYINAGHNPPLLYRQHQEMLPLKQGTPVLGFISPLPFLNEGCIPDLDTFFLFAYTDGLIEMMNNQKEFFGLERLVDYLSKNNHKYLKTIHQEIISMLNEFKGQNPYQDDITMLLLRVTNST